MIGKKFAQLRLVVLTVSMLLIQLVAKSQVEVSVPFNDGFIGLIGNNTNTATNIQRFGALEIAKVSFVQTTNSGRFELTQGNDIKGILRIQLTNGRKVEISGSVNWRVNSGSTNQLFGFIADNNIALNLSAYGGVNYSIQGGSTTGKSNFGFKLNNVAYTFPNNGQTVSGNAASGNTALTDLNAYLDAQPRVIAPVSANFLLNTPNQDPGDFVVANFAANDVILASIGLVNPPAGTTFSFGTTTGLTRSTGYNSWTGLTRISFTGSQANINAALASLSVTTGTAAGDVKLSVSASANDPGVFYNPANGHYYKPVSGAISYTAAKAAAATQTFKGRSGYLVTITSQSEQDFVNNNTSLSNIWIALSDANSEGTWYIDAGPEEGTVIWRTSSSNITNSTTSSYSSAGGAVGGNYINWCSSEPNNADGASGEDHAVTKWNSGTCWNDLRDGNTSSVGGYLVEYGTWSDPDENAFLDFYSASTTYVANCPSNQAPAAPIQVSAGTSAGASSVRLVVSVASGMTADWYASATGGSVLSGGQGVTTFNTPIITGTTTFYAQTRNSTTGCLSATRTALTATIVACPTTTPNVQFKLSPPDVTTSAIQGQAGSRTEDFNALSLGNLGATGSFAIGNFTKQNTLTATVKANDVWGGTGSQYAQLTSTGDLSITLTEPARYVGFWWAAGNTGNTVTIFGSCGGNEIQLGTFTSQTVINLLAGSTVTAVDGLSYNTNLYKRSNAANEPFAYINLELDDPTVYITRIAFSGGGFEFDNITTTTGYGAATFTTPSAPTISSITPGSGSVTVNFTAPTSNGGQAITNYEYSINGGTNWVAASPLVTTTPLVISGLTIGTTYPIRIRAVNSIGSGAQSNSVNASPIAVAPVITSFTPTTAGNGETVVITGTGFAGVNVVKFGNVNATSFVVNSSTQITAVVGAAASGDLLVQNSAGSDTEPGFIFKVVELKFEGNTLDQTAADRDGTVVGTATYGPGASGQAICFTSNANSTSLSNYLSLPNDLIRGRGTNFTVSLRFKTATFGAILGYQATAVNGSGAHVPILYVQEDGKLSANLWQANLGRLSVISSGRVDDNNWHKVEFSVAPGSITVYIDGVLAGSTSGTIDHLTMSFNQLGAADITGVWGGITSGGWIGFTGCIDEFLIIDKSLTATQIQQVTQLPLPVITSFTPTIAKSGETVTITGANFGSASSVKIGGVAARKFTVVSSTEIRAIVPFNATVNSTIEVTTAGGTITEPAFTYDCNSNALDFDATNDHVVVGDVIENLGAFSQEAWVYWKGSTLDYSEIFTKEAISAFAITNTNKLHANFGNGTSWGAGINSTTSIPLNTWTHVAVTRSSSGAVKLYINGVLDASTATLNLTGQNTSPRVIGGKLVGPTLFGPFKGSIDELKAWNTERTAQQIIAGMGNELIGNESGLIAYYNFNQGIAAGSNTTITTLNNLTAATILDGTLTNMARSGTTSNFVSGVWPVIVTQPAATLALCTNATSGNVLTVSAVGQQLTYQWYSNSTNSNSGGTAISGANTASFTVPTSSNGTVYYYVVVSGCSSTPITSNVSAITVSAPAVAGTLSGSQSICVGLTTSFSSTETGGTWSSSNAAIATVNASSGLVTGVGSGTATMTYTVIGCSSVSATRTVIVTAPPAVPVLSGSQNVCINGTTQFIATGESGALTFNGTTNIVETANNISALNITGDITVETWVKVNQLPNDWVRLVGKGDISNRTYGFWLATNGQLLWQIYGNGTDPTLFSTTSLQTGTWYHIAATRVGNVHTIYINGVARGSVTASITPSSSTLPLTLGYHGSIHTYLNGQMDEVRVWNVGRTATQINQNKDVEIAAQSGLVAYYKFNQGTAGGNNAGLTTLIDESGNGNNGTLRNFALIGNASNWSSRSGVPTTAGSWTSSNTSVATVSSTGVVTGVAAGTATITFTATGGGGCAEVTATRTVTVAPIPVISYSNASYSVERTSAITAIQPTSSGATVTSYAITPALPTGLTFNTTNGSISGTPSVVSASATYTVTGTTASGCVGTTTFTLNVFNAVAPSALSFAPGSQTVRQGTAITNMVPTASGGSVASYSISPALPAGLSFNTTTGIISGTLTAQQTGTVTYTITATNSGGSTTATVTLVYNTAPTDVALSSTSVAENTASGTAVASLSATDADAGDTHTYTLVSGTGDTDNASFTITGSTLSTAAVFDFETKSSYSVRVRVTDAGGLSFEKAFTIDVTNVNEVPTNISASASSVAENAASGTTVGTLAGTDADAGDTHTYTLVSGTGDTDNASFTISGSTLSTAAVFDFETKSSYSVRVRVTDAGGLTFEKVFTISVTDVNEAPTALALSNASVLENAASGTTVGTLAGTDADAGDTHTYTLVSGTGSTDNASFTITGTTLSTAAVFNFEAKNSYSVRVRVTDAGGLSFERAFTISVTDVNEAPTLTAITDRRVYNVSTSQVVNLAGITAGPETAQSTTTIVSTDKPATFSSISVVGTQIQFTLAPGIVTPQDVVVTVRVKDNGGVANGGVDSVVRTFRLGVDPMPVASASPNLITLGATAQLSAAGANAVNYTWVAVGGSGIVGSGATINVRPKGTTTYAVVVTNSFGYQATVPVLLTVIVDYKLVPNNLVTPNGDGVNDKWVIPNIDMYPDNEVMVYDKAGRAVFAKRGYNNEWDGTVNGKLLKEDAYFYVIKFNKDGALPIRGYVSIVR